MPAIPVLPETPLDQQPNDEITDTLLVIGSVGLIVIIGGSFALALYALDALKLSVPQAVIDTIGKQLVDTMKQAMDAVGKQVEGTPTPIDNIAFDIAKLPIEALISEISRRSADPDTPDALTALGSGPFTDL